MEATLEKIKTLVENSKSFGIIADNNPEEHELLLKEVLKETIASKNIPIISLPKDPEGFREKWSEILKEGSNYTPPRKTSIKIPKEKYKINQISYREDDKNVSLVIDLPQNELVLEDLSLEKLPPEADVVFCFFENEERLIKFESEIIVPSRDKIIFIKANGKTLTGKILDILKVFHPNVAEDKKKATILYAALFLETDRFAEKLSKETFMLAKLFTENGADIKAISKIAEKDKKASVAQLTGRILARTYVDEFFGISWSFLNSKDFQKTNNISIKESALYGLLKKVRSFIPQQNLYVLLWQTAEGIKALITASENKSGEYLVPFAEKVNARLESRFFTTGPFENFSEAEKHLRQSFKEEINNVLKDYVEDDPIIS